MTIYYAPTAIDLSRLPVPPIIEVLSANGLLKDFIDRFLAFWAEQRLVDPTLPAFDEQGLQTNPAIVAGRAWSYLRLLDRQRVNDGLRALLAPLATGANLDILVAARNIQREISAPATSTSAAVMEGDESLLRRFLESFDRLSAGSTAGHLFEARKAWPQSEDKTLGLWDARVNGYAVHKRRGDIHLVLIGPFGRLPTVEERMLVHEAVHAPAIDKEGVAVYVQAAKRAEYAASLVLEIPPGPDPSLMVAEAKARVEAVATERMRIGGEIPPGLLAGAAYGASIIKVRDITPVAIAADPYTVPVMTSLTITFEVRL